VRKYCPELADYPDKYIYEPWTAPIGIQQKAGCIIGKDYPKPIVKEKEAKAACLRKMQAAYQAKIYGNDPSVLDGTAPAPLAEAEAQLGPPAPVSGHKRKASGLEVAASDPKQQRLESMFSPKPKQTAQFASDESRM
jgi:cryptochrome